LRAAPPCDEAVWPPRASLSTVSQRTRYTPPGGATRILDIQTIALHTPDHKVHQMIVHVVDVTEHVQMEARLIENERFAASGRLAASVAHEINTPLQSLQTFVKLARNAATDTDRDTFLDYARDEIQRVGRIVRQLLELYRPDTPAPGPVDMIVLIERIILFIGKRIRDQKITVERQFADALPRAWGHSDELTQVLLNLIVNALDAMPYGGPLCIAARMADDRPHPLEISITDGGCGIAPELQERIFEPFVTTKEHGTGLGLAISAQIIRQHGGDISVESQAGAGSTFTIRLPTSRPEGADPEDQQHAHAPHDGGAATTDKDKG
jgi:two-component system NtrC family sensor kinase